jgi:hypothetical protein
MKYPAAHLLFLLDEKGEPYQVADVEQWTKEYPNQASIARDEIPLLYDVGTNPVTGQPFAVPHFVVSTWFYGQMPLYDLIGKMIDRSMPCYFETIVFASNGVGVDGLKCNLLESAKHNHKDRLEFWRKALGIDPSD